MVTPQEHAIAAFIAGAMSDPSTYKPIKLSKDSAFTERDLSLIASKRELDEAGFYMEEGIDALSKTHDTIAYNQALGRYIKASKWHARVCLQKSGKRLGDFYTHEFYYKTKAGNEERQEVFLRVYDSLNEVTTKNGYGLSLL